MILTVSMQLDVNVHESLRLTTGAAICPQVSSRSLESVVKLCPIEMFARDTRTLLQLHAGQLALQQFDTAYAEHFGVALVPASYGFPNTPALLHAISHVAVARGQGYRRTVVLCRQFEGWPWFNSISFGLRWIRVWQLSIM